jgi:transcriptional regulator with XRE-family HTH domain
MSDTDKKIGQRIKLARERINLTQESLGYKLGVTRPTVSQIELGHRKLSAEELFKIAGIFNLSINYFSEFENNSTPLYSKKIRIDIPLQNTNKFKEVILYLLNKVGGKPNIVETVLYKLLYFIDFNYYEKYEEQLIGNTYTKNFYGPVPENFENIMYEMINDQELIVVDDKFFHFPQTKFLAIKKPVLTLLKASELEVVDSVINKLSDMDEEQISDYSHKDVPWLTAEFGEKLNYESVFYRNLNYSVK